MAELEADWMKEGSRRVADEAWALIARHEREEHEGTPCPAHRLGLVAYIAHVVGIPARHGDALVAEILEYELEHDARTHGNGSHA